MTAAPPTGLPTPPPGQAPHQPPAPPRRPGYGLALTLAIVVTALPLIAVPIMIFWAAVSMATVSTAIVDEAQSWETEADDEFGDLGDETTDDEFVLESMLEIPFDTEIDPEAYAGVLDTFVDDPAWAASDAGLVSYTAWENASTGCIVSYLNGSVDPSIDLTQGDERASHGLIEWALETEADPEANISAIPTADAFGGTGTGSADAVIEYFDTDASSIAVLSRVFTAAGEGVIIAVECPTVEAVETSIATDLPAHLTLTLI